MMPCELKFGYFVLSILHTGLVLSGEKRRLKEYTRNNTTESCEQNLDLRTQKK